MATPLRPRGSIVASRPIAAAGRLAERLLELAAIELEHTDRPLARLAADRCLARLLDLCEAIAWLERLASGGSALGRARESLESARWALAQVNRQGAILPPAYRELVAGLDVVERRLRQIRAPGLAD